MCEKAFDGEKEKQNKTKQNKQKKGGDQMFT